MIYHSLEEIFEAKGRALGMIQEQVQGLTPSQAKVRPSNGEWTIGEIVEHLCIVEGQVLQLIPALLKKTEESGSPLPSFEISVRSFLERARKEKYVTRPKFVPTGMTELADSLEMLRGLQAQLFGLKPRLQAVDLTSVSFPHWLFGPLTLGQWLAFIGHHEERHLDQVKSIMGSTGPKP